MTYIEILAAHDKIEKDMQNLKKIADNMCNELMAIDHHNAGSYNIALSEYDYLDKEREG